MITNTSLDGSRRLRPALAEKRNMVSKPEPVAGSQQCSYRARPQMLPRAIATHLNKADDPDLPPTTIGLVHGVSLILDRG